MRRLSLIHICVGGIATYNAQWQTYFGDVVHPLLRNMVYTVRNRFMFLLGAFVPLLCGMILNSMHDSESKVMVLRIFYYISGAFLLLQAFVVSRIKGGERSPEHLAEMKKFSVRDIGAVFRQISKDRRFLSFFFSIMFFYLTWHLDFSMWYIWQTQYCGMTEAQLSYYVALNCISQLLIIGFFSRLNGRKSVYFTFIFGIVGLALSSASMLFTMSLPEAARSVTLLILGGAVTSMPQAAIGICTVQMLLNVVPKLNRALIISLYTIVVTLSNCFMPLFGVQLYIACLLYTSGRRLQILSWRPSPSNRCTAPRDPCPVRHAPSARRGLPAGL